MESPHRTAVSWAALCAALICSWSLGVRAQSGPERRVALFSAGGSQQEVEFADGIVSQLTAALAAEHIVVVAPRLAAPPAQPAPAVLAELRKAGTAGLREVGAGRRSAQEIFLTYQPDIERALSLASAVEDDQGRSTLWNLCLLQVQLMVMLPDGAEGPLVTDVVRECRRRFPDQREFAKVWSQEVLNVFQAIPAESATLDIRSAPASCEIRIYGAPVGLTPARVQVEPGTQEVLLRCAGGRQSALHTVKAAGETPLVIRLDGDAALQSQGFEASLLYPRGVGLQHAREHAAALAGEATADSFVLALPKQGELELSIQRTSGELLGSVTVARGASREERERAVTALLHPGRTESANSAKPAKATSPRRARADRWLGGSLLGLSLLSSIWPLTAIAKDGDCFGSSCDRVWSGTGAKTWLPVGVCIGGAIAGTVVLWAAPFGRRAYRVQLGVLSLQLGGTF